MKPTPLLLLLMLAAGCATTPLPFNTQLDPLDAMVPVARQETARRYHQKEENLWFSNLTCRYSKGHYDQDSTNALYSYTLVFFDPESVKAATHFNGFDAMGYHITLTPEGEYLGSSHGRGIGWSR